MGNDRFTEHAQNLLGCEKCNLRKAVGSLEMPIGCEINVIIQEGLIECYNIVIYKEGLNIYKEGLIECYNIVIYNIITFY